MELGKAELRAREHQAFVDHMPAQRAFRDEQAARDVRKKELKPLLSALNFVVARKHPELAGQKLVAERLSEADAGTLVKLVKKARAIAHEEDAEPLTAQETAEYERSSAVLPETTSSSGRSARRRRRWRRSRPRGIV